MSTYAPRPPMEGLRLFHGVVLSLPEFAVPAFEALQKAFAEPFVGITTDGTPSQEALDFSPIPTSTADIATAANSYLASLTRPDFREEAVSPLSDPARRRWFNAFPDWSPTGVLLDDLDPHQRTLAMRVVEISLGAEGFAATRKVMRLNGFLGEFVKTYVDSLREYTYFFTIFGEPRSEGAWAWQLMGHHLALNCLVLPDRTVQTPMFMGSEFNDVQGVRTFEREAEVGPRLLAALDDKQRGATVLYPSMDPEVLPPELSGPVDGRHRGGAGRDNIVLPFEGVCAKNLSSSQQELLMDVVDGYLGRFPEPEARCWRDAIVRHLDETHFAWIGDPRGTPPYYYKLHSPVIWIEFDHHPGIFLDNDRPERYHIHTIVRTPNGGDYGAHLVGVS